MPRKSKSKDKKVAEEPTDPIENNDVSDESSSEEEEEDEYGELLDKETDNKINQVLSAIKSNDEKLYKKEVRFFEDPEEAVKKLETSNNADNKPMYLHDYHRMNLLGEFKDDENKIVTYEEQKNEDRKNFIEDINSAFKDDNEEIKEDEDEEDDDGFFQKKTPQKAVINKETQLPDPDKDEEKFLAAFLDQHAWIPKNQEEAKAIDLGANDKEEIIAEQEFDDAVENFEKVYNFRYEDATSAEIVSYARNQATMRRSNMNSRKKQRLKKQEKVKEEKKKHDEKLKKKKQDKVNKVMDRLQEIKEAVGDEVSNETIEKVFGDALLNEDFDDNEWDSKMNEIFNEKYYDEEKVNEETVDIERPTWDEDDEIMKEFHDSKIEEKINDDEEPPKKKSKKEKLLEKKTAKKSKKELREQAELIVQNNIVKVEEEVEEEESKEKSANGEMKFKYIQVDPETFGLTQKEILLADDQELNDYISIKKLAPYRNPEHVNKDRRKVSKKKRLQEWRKKVFNDENGLQ